MAAHGRQFTRRFGWLGSVKLVCAAAVIWLAFGGLRSRSTAGGPAVAKAAGPGDRIDEGQQIFRFDTFGDEQLWTDKLRMHEVIESSLDPVTALSLGLKVDADALPDEVAGAISAGAVDLTDPATTVELIRLNAVVGVVGTVEPVDGTNRLTRVGI